MIRLRQVKVPLEHKNNLLRKASQILHIHEHDILNYKIVKESVDARRKDNILFIYEIDVEVVNETKILSKYQSKDVFLSPTENFKFVITGQKNLKSRPIIIGAGPAGLFCAYLLAENGYRPLIIERGQRVEERVKTIEHFWKTGELNVNSNVQFGEGGAGTFSDGKLNTLVKDKEFIGKKVFEIFVLNGAPSEIMYLNKPHIGTDLLRQVIINMRNKIIEMGGSFQYNTTLTDLKVEQNRLVAIEINNHEVIPCHYLFLALGHSARDTFKMLYNHNLKMEAKPFAVGLRIEHPQKMINEAQYGMEQHPYLKNASYKLTYKASNGRGVYSFCMCPGGYVVNASSELKHLVINGMSNHARESENANSALVVTVTPKDFGNHPLDGIEYQRKLESLAYNLCDGKIPVQLYRDFKNNLKTSLVGSTAILTKGVCEYANLNEILPQYVSDSLKEAIPYFGKKIKGFDSEDAVLLGIETRTSSPVRILRNENFKSSIDGIYPLGEGAGYAGGITTSAIDGIRGAMKFAGEYKGF